MARKDACFTVGLTGGIGTGKSQAAEIFRQYGVPVIDADEVTRELTRPGEAALVEIETRFGPQVIRDGQLNRAHLRQLIFSDVHARQDLENILHPRVRQRIRDFFSQIAVPYCIAVVPLLIETRMDSLVDRVLVVDTLPDIQLQRIMQRDHCTAAEAQSMIDAQISRRQRLEKADDILRNDQDLHQLSQQVGQLHQRYLAFSARAAF